MIRPGSVSQSKALLTAIRRPAAASVDLASATVISRTDGTVTSGTRMVVYTPDNEATRAAMEELAADPVQHHFPCWPAHQARTRDLLTI